MVLLFFSSPWIFFSSPNSSRLEQVGYNDFDVDLGPQVELQVRKKLPELSYILGNCSLALSENSVSQFQWNKTFIFPYFPHENCDFWLSPIDTHCPWSI